MRIVSRLASLVLVVGFINATSPCYAHTDFESSNEENNLYQEVIESCSKKSLEFDAAHIAQEI
ncbi:MAG: hypothetical protein E7478_03480, partial [Ruminococcaceae bacterium]|nr:hypothetical protein [Oscillospiraceae bacterium]